MRLFFNKVVGRRCCRISSQHIFFTYTITATICFTEEVERHVLQEVQEGRLDRRHQGVLAHPENKEKIIVVFG